MEYGLHRDNTGKNQTCPATFTADPLHTKYYPNSFRSLGDKTFECGDTTFTLCVRVIQKLLKAHNIYVT